MNRKQMLAAFDTLGGETKLNAILVSIKHWKMIGRVKYWKRLISEGWDADIYPDSENCALCELDNQECSNCGLMDEDFRYDPPCSLNYFLAAGGIDKKDRKQFLKGRRGLLKELAVLEAKERARLERKKI